ncbi:MAG: CDP-diacylglycerol--glycerol-3-phosphate 3-phosphatidyltransferase [Candidatus Omnitrophica bacterium]|nr:CDP-diacylglycerol--glycerol-3-phosphate 3-phosphatidyltransferase [Candidatus Omnitrophota bacterium]
MDITPNQLTWFRLIASPFIPYIFTLGGNLNKWIACFVYMVAALTDLLDGILARRRKQVTSLGKILDPIADKVLTLSALTAFVIDGTLHIAWLVPIAFRELSVTVARLLLIPKKRVVAAVKSGKIKTAIQNLAILFFFCLSLRLTLLKGAILDVLTFLAYGALTLAVWFTLKSGYDFFSANGADLLGRKN